MKKCLYAYFGRIYPFDDDIPGHYLYQPFLIDEIANLLFKEEDYQVDLYTYVSNSFFEYEELRFDHYLKPVEDMVADWVKKHVRLPQKVLNYARTSKDSSKIYAPIEFSLGDILDNIANGYYDNLILKARFRNFSTLSKDYSDALKFEVLVKKAKEYNIPVTIVDTDLSFSDYIIDKLINDHENVKIVGLGDLNTAYNGRINQDKILPGPLYGISLDKLIEVRDKFATDPSVLTDQKKSPILLFYGNIASKAYKDGHSKNQNALDYMLRLTEEDFWKRLNGYIIGKVENNKFLNEYVHVKRYNREKIADLHKLARISLNISKDLYDLTNFTPARITESWIYGVLPLSFTQKKNYQGNSSLAFKNYIKFREAIMFYMFESTTSDYVKYYFNCLDNYIAYRKEREKINGQSDS